MEPDDSERRAAWEMYVELVTRVSLAPVDLLKASLREALSSLYSVFDTTREILRKYGPNVAQPKGKGTLSFGYLAVAILNTVLRPVLSEWHPLLLDYESIKPNDVSTVEQSRGGRETKNFGLYLIGPFNSYSFNTPIYSPKSRGYSLCSSSDAREKASVGICFGSGGEYVRWPRQANPLTAASESRCYLRLMPAPSLFSPMRRRCCRVPALSGRRSCPAWSAGGRSSGLCGQA